MVLRSLNNIIPARIKFDSSFISLPFFLSIYLSIIGGIYRFLASLAYFLSTSFSFLGVYTLFPFLKHHFFLLGHLFSPFSIMMIWLAAHLHYRLDAYSQKSMRTGSLSFFSYPFSSFHFGTVGLNIYDTHASGRLFCHYHYYYPSAFGQQVLTILLQWDFCPFLHFLLRTEQNILDYLCIDLCVVIHRYANTQPYNDRRYRTNRSGH